jgi:hypothetical protein
MPGGAGRKLCGAVPKTISAEKRPIPSLGGGQEPEEDPGQLLAPGTINTGGPEGVLLVAMEPLDHPVTLGVVGSSLMMSDAERTAQRRCQTAETN